MIWKQLGALDYELHMDYRKTKVLCHTLPWVEETISVLSCPCRGKDRQHPASDFGSIMGTEIDLCVSGCVVVHTEGQPSAVRVAVSRGGSGEFFLLWVPRQDGCAHPCLKMLQLQVC